MPGGRIAPDGRPAQVPGVGKTARRHDLEAPATPGLHDSDLQQGDVSQLENAQRIAPTPKRTQSAAGPGPRTRRQGVDRGSDQFAMQVPDPIDMAAGRSGGKAFQPAQAEQQYVDPTPWLPLMRQMASAPNTGGGFVAAFVEQMANFRRQPFSSRARLIDLNEADEILGG